MLASPPGKATVSTPSCMLPACLPALILSPFAVTHYEFPCSILLQRLQLKARKEKKERQVEKKRILELKKEKIVWDQLVIGPKPARYREGGVVAMILS